MFYKKDFATKKNKTLTFRFNKFDEFKDEDDGKLEINQTKSCYNYTFNSGALVNGYGFEQLALPTSNSKQHTTFNLVATDVLKVWSAPMYEAYSQQDKYYVFYLNEDKQINFFNVSEDKFPYETTLVFQQVPNAAVFRINSDNDTMFFASPADQTKGLNNLGTQTYENIPKFISGCWYGPYLFLLTIGDNNKLKYSKKRIDIWNNDNVLDVDLPDIRGDMTALVALKDYLYLFTKFGITRLSLYSTSQEVAQTNIFHSNSYIFPQSIARCGESIIFYTDDGIYRLKGSGVEKLEHAVIKNIVHNFNHDCSGVCFCDKYYFACKYDFGDGDQVGCESGDYVNNAMLILDLNSNEFDIVRGIDIKQLFTIQTQDVSKLCAIFRGEKKGYMGQLCHDGKFFGQSMQKRWDSCKTDFGYAGKDKCITQIVVQPHTQGTIIISSENQTKKIEVSDKDVSQRFRVRVFGKVFSLSFTSQQDSFVSCPEFKVQVFS